MTRLLELRGITKVFQTDEVETHALAEIDLTIRRGEYVSVEGPSGCGKTTLLSVLGLLDTPSGGEYLLDGAPVANLSAAERARIRNRSIGFIFQAFNLIGDLTVSENVELPLTYRGAAAAERRLRAMRALARVGLQGREHHTSAELSGGQQQRVAIARAIVTDPVLLLADEPTGNLDSRTSREIMELVTGLNRAQGITVIMVTHEPDIAAYARRIVRFVDGRIESDAERQAA